MPVQRHRNTYPLNFLACLAGTLLLFIALVNWWPIEATRIPDTATPNEREVVHLESVTPTRQQIAPPPPPAAVAPSISVPRELIPAEDPLDLDLAWQSTSSSGEMSAVSGGRDSSFVPFSDEAPRPVRFAEPTYPPAAWQRGICAQIVVEVTVDEKGQAKTHRITDRYLIKHRQSNHSVSAACCSEQIMRRELVDTSDRARVDHLGHGLEEAALGAAWKWRFHPPTKDGRALASLAVLTFTFGR